MHSLSALVLELASVLATELPQYNKGYELAGAEVTLIEDLDVIEIKTRTGRVLYVITQEVQTNA
jgi:hypothetical protein